MNNVFITGYILDQPIKFLGLKYYLTEIKIVFSHTQNKQSAVIALAHSEIGDKIFEFYKKGDYVFIEGESLVIENKNYNTDLVIYISNIQAINRTIKK